MIADFYNSYKSFLGAVSLGVIFGILYDIFRILRISRMPHIAPAGKFYDRIAMPKKDGKKHKNVKKILHISDSAITIIEDILFWLIITLSEILFIYHVNGGEIRIYFFVCNFIGAAIYFFTAGKLMMFFSVRSIFIFRCLLYWLIYIIIYPVRKILSLFKRILMFMYTKIMYPAIMRSRNRRETSYSMRKCAEMLKEARMGFSNYGRLKSVTETKEKESDV